MYSITIRSALNVLETICFPESLDQIKLSAKYMMLSDFAKWRESDKNNPIITKLKIEPSLREIVP